MPTDSEAGFRFLRSAQQDEGWPWFEEHYEQAAGQVIDFLAEDGRSLAGQQVADVGCGDGIIDLGLLQRAQPARVVGFDLEPVDRARLAAEARAAGVVETALPAELEFRTNTMDGLPAPDASFDTVVSWSTFEHVRWPVGVLSEIRRILRPDGLLFLQIWPLYYSMHGSHLWPWYPDGYAQLKHRTEELAARITQAEQGRTADVAFIIEEFENLNRITVDELQRCILAAGLHITKFELMTGSTHVTRALARHPLTDLGISGIKLLAVPSD